MTEPITPNEVHRRKKLVLPDEVIEAFNELITKYYNNHKATFTLKEVAQLIAKRMNLESVDRVYQEHWLEVREVYGKAGWKVQYEKPGYTESGEAYFTFLRPPPTRGD